jgi:periplasmic divalent cation tolerance protein
MSLPVAQLVFTQCPTAEVAQTIARALVEAQLAACVTILPPCRAIYRWQGKICEDDEVPLLIKTTAEGFAGVAALIRQRHPYELPEIVAVDIAQGLPAYLAWLASEVVAPAGG